MMTHFLITTCCKDKDESSGLLPAIERYQSERIKQIYEKSQQQDLPMLILSGEFGLLRPTDLIPWYDHALQMAEVPALVPQLVRQLTASGVSRVTFYARPASDPGWAPYHATLEQACQEAGVNCQWEEWKEPMQQL